MVEFRYSIFGAAPRKGDRQGSHLASAFEHNSDRFLLALTT